MTKMMSMCPRCGLETEDYRSPVPTVDIVIEVNGRGIVLIKRKNTPVGWALRGGFVDYGESLEKAAVREAFEETSLRVELEGQFHTYSDPSRNPRQHTISTVFIARADGTPKAADDAVEISIFKEDELPGLLMFDHSEILAYYFVRGSNQGRTSKRRTK
jgi:ADP-ribose pyrophosphatase YjhB (NUDIX family)